MSKSLLFRAGLAIAVAVISLRTAAQVLERRFENREAWELRNDKLRLTVVKSGGHIGEIVLTGDRAVNPLWIQSRPTIDADKYETSKHEAIYGGGSGARLMSGLMGHNVCFPYWGDPSRTEAAAGMTFHGETGIVRWRQIETASNLLAVEAQLPESAMRLRRIITLKGQVAQIEETAYNEKAWDKPVGWCQHVTLGPPFLDRGVTQFEASLTRGRSDGHRDEFTWPSGLAEKTVDLRTVRKLEQSPGFVNHFLVDPKRSDGFFTAFHPRHRLVFGYVFPRADYPWLNIWESNSPEMLTRGMEFSNTPIHGTLKVLMKTPELWGHRTFDWLDAKAELKKTFWLFSLQVPENFAGVADVQRSGGSIVVIEKATQRRYEVPQE